MKVHKVVMVRNIVICWSLSSQVLLSLASALTLHNVQCRLSKNHVALPFAALALLPFAAISLYIYIYISIYIYIYTYMCSCALSIAALALDRIS